MPGRWSRSIPAYTTGYRWISARAGAPGADGPSNGDRHRARRRGPSRSTDLFGRRRRRGNPALSRHHENPRNGHCRRAGFHPGNWATGAGHPALQRTILRRTHRRPSARRSRAADRRTLRLAVRTAVARRGTGSRSPKECSTAICAGPDDCPIAGETLTTSPANMLMGVARRPAPSAPEAAPVGTIRGGVHGNQNHQPPGSPLGE